MKILATFDQSPFSELIIPQLATLAALPDVEMDLLSVAEALPGMSSEAIGAHVDELKAHLKDVVGRLPMGPTYRIHTDISTYPAVMIIAWAKAEHSDLIVMATHGRGGVGRLLLGSVAAQVMHAWVAPILLVHPPTD